jgi:hypothetical protein
MIHLSRYSCDVFKHGLFLSAWGVDVERFSPFAELNSSLCCVDAEDKIWFGLGVSYPIFFSLSCASRKCLSPFRHLNNFGGCLDE